MMDNNRPHHPDSEPADKGAEDPPPSSTGSCPQGACSRNDADSLCREISGELVDIVQWLSEGELSPDQFRRIVADLEARKLQRHGFRLDSASGEDGQVHFSLRFAKSDDLCASLDVDPRTGDLTVQHTCA